MNNGKQCIIIWHVDDLKISHVDPKVVNDVIRKLKKKFGQESPPCEIAGQNTRISQDVY